MRDKHYKSQLSAFADRELSKTDQQVVAEHLMKCIACRAEHDRIKFGSALAQKMERHDAPAGVWIAIDASLDGETTTRMGLIPDASFFSPRGITGFAIATVVVAMFVSGVYFMRFRADTDQANTGEPSSMPQVQTSQPISEIVAVPANTPAFPETGNSNIVVPNTNVAAAPGIQASTVASVPAFQFETLAGMPRVGSLSTASSLAVGDYLETDTESKARIQVANIGNVEIAPNSRVKLVGSDPKQHRLSLERGVLEAQIIAPPRLFFVDTPSAVAVDLGCAYKLEVDRAGNSYLHVTSGFVALERGGRESIVPAGAMCITKRGKGVGTPFSAETSEKFRAALERFDFSNGGSRAVGDMLANRNFYDMISLWHLLTRVPKADREKVYDALAAYVTPPVDVSKVGLLSLDKKMLASWRAEVEKVWFE